MTVFLEDLTSPDVAAILARTPVAVLPFGSVEQHGPHLPCGTDAFASELVARRLAERLGALYAPFCPYGVTPIHAGHPGTVSLRRQTFELLLEDVSRELVAMGARTLLYVNWHEVNTSSLNSVAIDLQEDLEVRVYVAQACYVAQRIYQADGGSLTHGGSIETMAVMAHDPVLIKWERAIEPPLPQGAEKADEMRRSHEVYGFITDVSEIAPDGWYGNPHWATPERAASFPDAVVNEIVTRLTAIGAVDRS